MAFVLPGCGDDASPGDGTATESTSASSTISTTLGTSVTTTLDPTGSTTDDPTASSGDETTTGAPICPATHACVGVPTGWTGPALLRESDDPRRGGECPVEYPDLEPLGGAGLTAAPAECGCTCGSATGTSCALETRLNFWGDDPTCSDGTPASSYDVFTTICNDFQATLPGGSYFQVEPVIVEGGSCNPQPVVALPPAAFAATASTCGGATLLEGCVDDEVCAPRADDDALCVWQAGDSDCPEGFDGRRGLYYGTIDDTRGCDDCTCSDPIGLCDGAAVTLFANVCNPPISGLLAANGECNPGSLVSGTQSAIFAVGEPTAFCVADDVVPVGVATPSDPVTVCCRA